MEIQNGFMMPLLIMVLAVVVIGGGVYYYFSKKGSPETVVKNFISLIQDGKADTAYESLDPKAKLKISLEKFKETSLVKIFSNGTKISSWRSWTPDKALNDTDPDGNFLSINGIGELPSGEQVHVTSALQKQQDKTWKILTIDVNGYYIDFFRSESSN